MEDELGIYRTSYQGQGVLEEKVCICVLKPSLFLYEFMFINLVTSFSFSRFVSYAFFFLLLQLSYYLTEYKILSLIIKLHVLHSH